jgi:Leucine-rich repeat (LRR) protein
MKKQNRGKVDYLILSEFDHPEKTSGFFQNEDLSHVKLIYFLGDQSRLIKSGIKIPTPNVEHIIFAGKRTIGAVENFEALFNYSPNLKSLNFVNTPIYAIPEFTFRNKNLEDLSFRNPQFSTLPSRLFELKKLKKLMFVPAPAITHIPDEIFGLKKLEFFALHHATPQYISTNLFKLPLIKNINLNETLIPRSKKLLEAIIIYTNNKDNYFNCRLKR